MKMFMNDDTCGNYESCMIQIYLNWCEDRGYDQSLMSADELLHKLMCESDCDMEEVEWLETYIKLWNMTIG